MINNGYSTANSTDAQIFTSPKKARSGMKVTSDIGPKKKGVVPQGNFTKVLLYPMDQNQAPCPIITPYRHIVIALDHVIPSHFGGLSLDIRFGL